MQDPYFLGKARSIQAILRRQNQEIEANAARLQAANALKDRLFSIIGHDLRSPVASMKATLTLLSLTNPTPALDDLERDVNALHRTLDNLLYWALTQRDGLRTHPRAHDLTEVVADVLEGFEGLIVQKNLSVTFLPDRDGSPVCADENLTLIVLRNVMHNALKFTPKGGSVTVSIRKSNGLIHLTVTDTGPGMNVAQLPENPLTNPAEGRGTGLGLPLSRELMRRNGGSLDLESQPGHGTTVTLRWNLTWKRHQPGGIWPRYLLDFPVRILNFHRKIL